MFLLSISCLKTYSFQAPNQLGKEVPHKSQKKSDKGGLVSNYQIEYCGCSTQQIELWIMN